MEYTVKQTRPLTIICCTCRICEMSEFATEDDVRIQIARGSFGTLTKTPQGWLCRDCQLALNLRRWCA